jgi:uncharacterized membrane protein YraQ (UPF0718 family)
MIREIFEKFGASWVFFITVVLIYLATSLLDISVAIDSLSNFSLLFLKILPTIVAVFILIFVFNLFVEPKTLVKYLGGRSGIIGWLVAIVGGIISTGPIYMWYPLLADLKEKGVRRALLAAFLYSRAVKPALLPLMIYYFGLAFAVVVCIYISLFSIINGSLVEYFSKEEK